MRERVTDSAQEKLIRVDQQTGAYEIASRFWALGQFARFVRPGAVRIGTSGGSGLQIAAFKNKDTSYAVVMTTSGSGGEVTVTLPADFTMGEAGVWASDATKKIEKIQSTISGQTVKATVPGTSVTTFWIKRGTAAAPVAPAAAK
jgi:O-glycosyl hydrolase